MRLKPAYLIHGDDHGAIVERRARLRALAEAQQGVGAGIEQLEGDRATPELAAAALAAMTLAIGRRVIIVEGVERWRDADVEKHLVPALQSMPPETTLALFAREEARVKAPAAAHRAVAEVGGQVVAQMMAKPWELAKWVRDQAHKMGLELDPAAAKALVAQVGERPQRLLRELEKLALEGDQREGVPARRVGAEEVELRAAQSAEWRAYALADALVGADAREATRSYLRLREQGERLPGLTYLMAARLRDALELALRLRSGSSPAELKRSLRMPARAADRLLADVARSDPERLRSALIALAELEVDSRGGAALAASRSPLAGLGEETLAVRAIETISG